MIRRVKRHEPDLRPLAAGHLVQIRQHRSCKTYSSVKICIYYSYVYIFIQIYKYIYAFIYIYIYIFVYVYIHIRPLAAGHRVHIRQHRSWKTCSYVCICIHICEHTHRILLAPAPTGPHVLTRQPLTHTHTLSLSHAHTHTRTHSQSHTPTQIHSRSHTHTL